MAQRSLDVADQADAAGLGAFAGHLGEEVGAQPVERRVDIGGGWRGAVAAPQPKGLDAQHGLGRQSVAAVGATAGQKRHPGATLQVLQVERQAVEATAEQPAETIEAAWDVTSDSLALILAMRLRARRLILVKSGGEAAADLVDAAFARLRPGYAGEIWILHRSQALPRAFGPTM